MDDVCNDMKVLNVNKWEKLAPNTKAWNCLFEKAKTHEGL
jgi:hypothetical protein